MTAAIFGLGPLEIIIIAVILIVLFLPTMLPRIVSRLAETIRSFRQMTEKTDSEEEKEDQD